MRAKIGDVVIDKTYNKRGNLAIVVGEGILQPILIDHKGGITMDKLRDYFAIWDGLEVIGHIDFEEVWEKAVRLADRKTENGSEKPNNCEHITENGVTCAKYPACDDCPDNPLNKVKGSKRLIKGSEQAEQTEPKRGEWLEQEECWQCSVCGDEFVLEVGVKPIDAKMNFCPNCGARMSGSEKPNNCTDCECTDDCTECREAEHGCKDEPQICSVTGRPYSECGSCEHFKCTADEPQTETQTETQNSNLTFEKQTDCAWK